jgi:hypothetical protein
MTGNTKSAGVAYSDPVLTNITLTGMTVAQLPAAATSAGMCATVTDSNAALTAGIGAVVATGGSNVVPVFCDGSAWRIG